MTQRIDRERLDAIRQKANENSTRHPRGWLAVYGADVTWLLDRLAALLSLQTATQWQPIATVPSDADFIMAAWPCTGAASGFDVGEVSREGPTTWMNFYGLCVPTYWMPLPKPPAALLPDPAGTQLTNDDDDHARVDSERLTDRPRTAPTERR